MTTLDVPPLVKKYLQEDDLNQECRELLSSLPRERGWITKHYYQYEGFWATARFIQNHLACNKHFKAQETDIILVTNPKSGTTWLKALAFALLNRSRFLDLHHHPLLTTNPHDLVPFLERMYHGTELPDLSNFTSPRLFATHVPVGSQPRSVKDSSCKIVYMSRNPKDVFASAWHFSNKMRPQEWGANKLEDVFDGFCNGMSVFGPFWNQVLGYWNESVRNPHKVLFLKYEEIKEQPAAQLQRLAEFLDCPFSSKEEDKGTVDDIIKLCSFDHLSKLEVNKTGSTKYGVSNKVYFRKGEIGSWAEVLTPEMAERLDHLIEEKLLGSGFKY